MAYFRQFKIAALLLGTFTSLSLAQAGVLGSKATECERTLSHLPLDPVTNAPSTAGTGAEIDQIVAQTKDGYFDQKLNPDDPLDSRTFKQHYFINSAYASGPNAPVIYYICGEAECTTSFIKRFAGQVAKRFGAHLVALEHRYYGKSLPFESMTTENLKYLSSHFAIEDLASFERYAQKQFGLSQKWICMGGSYAGVLSAYYRMEHPELVMGALASSAPVEAKNDFWQYDFHVSQVLGKQCGDAVRGVIQTIENASSSPAELARIKELFDSSKVARLDDFFGILSDMAAEAVQYHDSEKFCKLLLGKDPMAGYAQYTKEIFKRDGDTAYDHTPEGGFGKWRPWIYQSCTEFGFWQVAYRDPKLATRSARLNLDYNRELCKRVFGIDQLADVDALNRQLYDKLLNPANASHILFTNGSEDPWSELSISKERGNATNPETFTAWITGKAHCSDLHCALPDDPQSLKDAQDYFMKLVQGWLNGTP